MPANDSDDLPTLTIEFDPDHGLYVCVPQAELPGLQDYLEDQQTNCQINPRRLADRRRPGTDLIQFNIDDVQCVEDILTDYGFNVAPE